MERKYKMPSCMKIWPIMKNNNNDAKLMEFQLLSHMTILFWCSNEINFEYRLKEQPTRNEKFPQYDFL
jgi:hypothetical protein